MRLVGLTGGIATGKSTAARAFARAGAVVIDADRVARQVVEPGTEGLEAVRAAFGDGVVRPDGSLDREALGRIVFADAEARERLNRILHPRIQAEVDRRVREAVAADPKALVVYDVPLLFETKAGGRFDLVVVVYVPPELQLRRLMLRDGLAEKEAGQRLAAQMPIDEKARRADVVLDNRGPPERLEEAVAALVGRIRAHNRRFWG
ncbi:MAG: dephospho-CoA kinase [Candidatus Dadabacteria bacterium]|nr:MAG: dephospho-CoA kinase [Candidatus Dadabacteria bacterium]